jgi:hypothetical protein
MALNTNPNPHPGLTEQRTAAKIVTFPRGSGRPRPRRRVEALQDPQLASHLVLDADNRFLRVDDTPGWTFLHDVGELVGRLLEECWTPTLYEHWAFGLDRCRYYNQPIDLTYEWAHEGERMWVARTATFIPRARGIVDVYVRHLGTRPFRDDDVQGTHR